MKKDSDHSAGGRSDEATASSSPADATQSLAASDVFRTKPDADTPGPAEDQSEITDHPIPGKRFGPYRIERMLGSGGMGEVYEAEHIGDGHRVALKVLRREAIFSDEHRERFLREGRVAASISHPRSLYVYGTEEVGGLPVISMELAPGGTLRDRVEAKELGPFLDRTREMATRKSSPAGIALDAVAFLTAFLFLIVVLSLLLVSIAPQRLLVGGGPFAFVVVDGEGRLASRRRMLARNLVMLAPFLPALASMLFLPFRTTSGYLLVSFVLFTGGVIWAIASPSRGFPDRIARTWLVPR